MSAPRVRYTKRKDRSPEPISPPVPAQAALVPQGLSCRICRRLTAEVIVADWGRMGSIPLPLCAAHEIAVLESMNPYTPRHVS